MVTTSAEIPFTSVIPSVHMVVRETECSMFPLVSLLSNEISFPRYLLWLSWCVAYADISKLKAADKVWFPENETLKKCTRFDDNKVDTWILTVSNDKFTPAETLRLSKFETYHQLAIPYAMLDNMKVCGKCYPLAEGKNIKSQYPVIDWKSGPWAGSNTIKKRDALDPRAPAVCPLKSKPAPTPTPKGKATPKPKGKATPKPKAARPKAARPKTSRPESSKPKAKEPAEKE
jgi:hypothetical protein